MRKVVISMISFYQKYISLDTGVFSIKKGTTCVFYPTCSEYTKQAIVKYGPLVGAKLGYKRVLRCRPGNEPGVDLVP